MTNFEKIKQMSVEELAALMGVYVWEDNIFSKWFDKEMCQKCSDYTYCEGECPFFKDEKDIVRLWLESEADNE